MKFYTVVENRLLMNNRISQSSFISDTRRDGDIKVKTWHACASNLGRI